MGIKSYQVFYGCGLFCLVLVSAINPWVYVPIGMFLLFAGFTLHERDNH